MTMNMAKKIMTAATSMIQIFCCVFLCIVFTPCPERRRVPSLSRDRGGVEGLFVIVALGEWGCQQKLKFFIFPSDK